MVLEVIGREFQDHLELLQGELAAGQFRCVERSFVVVAQQMLVVVAVARGRRRQQMLRQNYPRAQTGAIRWMTAFSNSVETVTGSDNPGIGGRALQILAKVFEYRWRL